jgi:hypothetical protein
MPYSAPINFDHGTTGLSPTAAVYETDKSTVVSAQTAVALAEFPAGSGQYSATVTLADAGGFIAIDDGTTDYTLAYDRNLATQSSVDTQLADLPTVAELEARTLPSSEYFDPATDPVATVTNLTNLPSIPTNWITADGVASNAVNKITAGLSTLREVDIRSAVGLASANLDTQLADLPTVAELEARTLIASAYFDPATDPVATVTNLTNLPAIPANWITAAGIATGAITSAKFATGAITSTVVAANTIGASQIAANAITSAKIATDAIGSAQLASTAVTEIQSGLATSATQSTITDHLTDIKGATFNGLTDSLEAIRDRGDTSWVTATIPTSDISAILTAVNAAKEAAEAVADGREIIDYDASTFTVYNTDGNIRTVFDLRDKNGNSATTAQNAIERVPQ